MALLEEWGTGYYAPSRRHREWYQLSVGLDDISLTEGKSQGMKIAVGFPRPICVVPESRPRQACAEGRSSNPHRVVSES